MIFFFYIWKYIGFDLDIFYIWKYIKYIQIKMNLRYSVIYHINKGWWAIKKRNVGADTILNFSCGCLHSLSTNALGKIMNLCLCILFARYLDKKCLFICPIFQTSMFFLVIILHFWPWHFPAFLRCLASL